MFPKPHVGQQVKVVDVNGRHYGEPSGGWDGVVTAVGRKWFTVKYGNTIDQFSLENGRNKDSWQRSVKTLEQVERAARRAAAKKTLKDHGVRLADDLTLTVEQLEALAAVAATFPTVDRP